MAIRVTTMMTARGVLNDINRAQDKLVRTQEQLSSGKMLTKPSDDPAAVSRSLMLRTEMESAQQFKRNVDDAQGWADVTDSALESVADALLRARELVIQAGTDSAGPETRNAIAAEIRGLVDTVKSAGNAMYGGRFIFAGTETDVPPYTLAGTDAYAGNTADINRQVGPGVTVAVNVNGRSAIGDDASGLLKVMRDVLGYLDVNDGVGVRGTIPPLDNALDSLNAVRAQVGATMNRLEVAGNRAVDYEGTTLKLLSDTEDTDMAKAMVDFSIQQAAMTAGLKAGSQIVQNSLLDFLR